MNNYEDRKIIIIGIFLTVGLLFIIRLFYLQIINESYKLSSNNNVLRYITDYPARGYIFDRGGELLVYNQPVYDLMVIPKQVTPFDTVDLCKMTGITTDAFKIAFAKAKNYSRFKESIIEKQLSAETYATLQEKLYKFPGFYVQPRTIRKYPRSIAGHVVGYISEVDERIISKNPYYKKGDYIGFSGMEQSYEKELRGRRGQRIVMVDVHNRIKGSFQDGEYDTLSIGGKNLTSTIDANLQAYGELLMRNKSGSIVAIEPSTGEILMLVTSPAYDPNLLVGRVRSRNYNILLRDTMKPLFNRALMAQYPPGSTFKLINALIGQQVGVAKPSTTYSCRAGFHAGGLTVGCHAHPSSVDLKFSITTSCNAYYCNVFKTILEHKGKVRKGYDIWRDHVMSFGLGDKFNFDLPNELKGLIPSGDYYDKYHGKDKWKALTVISLAIGQGEIGITPMQMANMTATIANRGYYYTPHIVKAIDGIPNRDPRFSKKHEVRIDTAHFNFVVEAMHNVVLNGTARGAKLDSIAVCGKTGTAQNPHGKDHSIFISFAPKENPKIAIAVYVENAGFGATWAVPIASLLTEKYLTGKIKRLDVEKRMLEGNLISKVNSNERTKKLPGGD